MLYKFLSQDYIPLEIPLHYQYNTDLQPLNYHPLHLMTQVLIPSSIKRVFSLDQLSIGTVYPSILATESKSLLEFTNHLHSCMAGPNCCYIAS